MIKGVPPPNALLNHAVLNIKFLGEFLVMIAKIYIDYETSIKRTCQTEALILCCRFLILKLSHMRYLLPGNLTAGFVSCALETRQIHEIV